MTWYTKSGMVDAVLQGFNEKIKALAPDLDIEYQGALPSEDEFGAVVQRFNTEKDGMLVLRSHGATWLKKHPPSIPAFIGACSNPQELGVVMNLNEPEGNITGVTYYLDHYTQIKVFQAMVPNMKKILLLVENGHPSSPLDQKGTRDACTKLGIAYQDVVCSSVDDLLAAVGQNTSIVNAFIIGNQVLIMDNTKQIVESAGKTPVLAYSSKPVKDGALGGFVADNIKLGQMLAESVVDVLINGKSVREVPVKFDPEPQFYINGRTVVDLGIEVPANILQFAKILQ
ncbi:MAG: ABC transporter substrate-binding protein [Desulfomonilia bacterium]